VDELTTTSGLVALAAAALALAALAATAVLARRLRRLRSDQRAVLGDANTDLVAHAAGLDRGFGDLRDFMTDAAARLDGRLAEAERRLDGAVSFHAIVRYDAYNEMSGRQSTSVALLDAQGSGVVLSSIHHRDQARLYAKHVVAGRGELELSPEEEEAIRSALAGAAPGEASAPR
jgi:Protein of unknown function (DUF4446)